MKTYNIIIDRDKSVMKEPVRLNNCPKSGDVVIVKNGTKYFVNDVIHRQEANSTDLVVEIMGNKQ